MVEVAKEEVKKEGVVVVVALLRLRWSRMRSRRSWSWSWQKRGGRKPMGRSNLGYAFVILLTSSLVYKDIHTYTEPQ